VADKNVAYNHLVDSVLRRHAEHKAEDSADVEDDYFEFTEDELKRIVEALWIDRYASERKTFKGAVGDVVSKKVAGE
jgi:hypothetical protein